MAWSFGQHTWRTWRVVREAEGGATQPTAVCMQLAVAPPQSFHVGLTYIWVFDCCWSASRECVLHILRLWRRSGLLYTLAQFICAAIPFCQAFQP